MKKLKHRVPWTRRRQAKYLRELWALAYDVGFEAGQKHERQESGRTLDQGAET
jgi:hypothetical protein